MITSSVYLDSSAFTKLFVWETGSIPLLDFLSLIEDGQKNLSVLALLEVQSAMARRLRIGEIRQEQYVQALSDLKLAEARYSFISVESSLIRLATDLIQVHSLRSLDALQLATAVELQQELRPEPILFIASDRRLLAVAEAEQLRTWNPIEPPPQPSPALPVN